jgi:hypothetical protein
MNDGENNIYKLAKTREMETKGLSGVKCIKDEYDKSISTRRTY